ncbi:DUF3533 domain-containing protein [Streptomyces sp. NPDC020412]|uniref:DUF3533 domain-containing protein n=1 Tax=Streptomyces sp. NPDC020412 TaxID=3365073 RepID=UPI0037874442
MTPTSDDPGHAAPSAAPPPRPGFFDEVRDAVHVRAALLIIGVLALQLGFITSYIGAFHDPKPKEVPIAVAAPTPAAAAQAVRRLGALPGDPLAPRAVADEASAAAQVRDRDVDGALVLTTGAADRLLVASASGASLSEALTAVVTRSERAQGRSVDVVDLVPNARGDARGLTSFYLVIGWCVGGYLCAAALAISAGARPANPARGLIRLAVLLLYAAVTGLLGAIIAGPVLDALPGGVPALWGLGTLLVFAVGAITLALQGLAGIVGIGLAILVVVVLGNPSAGGAYPYPLLPPFWQAIGPALPPGAGTYAARSISYFGGSGATGPLLVIAAWAAGGAVVTMVCAFLRRRADERDGGAPLTAAAGDGGTHRGA